MDRRGNADQVAANVAAAASRIGDPVAVIAEATGLTVGECRARLEGDAEFDVAELVNVGGLLRVSVASFLEGVAA